MTSPRAAYAWAFALSCLLPAGCLVPALLAALEDPPTSLARSISDKAAFVSKVRSLHAIAAANPSETAACLSRMKTELKPSASSAAICSDHVSLPVTNPENEPLIALAADGSCPELREITLDNMAVVTLGRVGADRGYVDLGNAIRDHFCKDGMRVILHKGCRFGLMRRSMLQLGNAANAEVYGGTDKCNAHPDPSRRGFPGGRVLRYRPGELHPEDVGDGPSFPGPW